MDLNDPAGLIRLRRITRASQIGLRAPTAGRAGMFERCAAAYEKL